MEKRQRKATWEAVNSSPGKKGRGHELTDSSERIK